jgi:CelD/BcsL family acetyltransferase involved in cellulose biosynthesis/GNAT superfamily N-acetyltransferase
MASGSASVAQAASPAVISAYTIEGLDALERALMEPPLSGWEGLLDRDPSGTPFQSPVWVMPWYRSYRSFDPRVLVIVRGGELIGVVPLAIATATRRLTFAGDNMTDYRDVVAHPPYRREVVQEFLLFLKRGRHSVLHLGSTYPESETPAVVLEVAAECGIYTHLHYNDGWRWWPHEQKEDPLKKKSVRYPINYFKRTGTLLAEHVQTEERWAQFKERFYPQHTLRQLFGGRAVSLNDPQKQAFFDALFRSKHGHVTALWYNGELIAGHVGTVFCRVLYWGAPSFDIRQRQYSPNIVLLTLTMAEHERWQFDGLDMTIGTGEVKERFSTSRVVLPWVELYTRRDQFLLRQARAASAKIGRNIASHMGGHDTWDKRFKPLLEKARHKLARVKELGPAQAASRALETIAAHIGGRRRGIVYLATPADVRETMPMLREGDTMEIHDNTLEDLAKRHKWDDQAAREISSKVRTFTDGLKANRTFHTVLINDLLAAWGYSYWPTEPATLTEIGPVQLHFEPNSVSLYDFYTLPEYRGRKLYPALLTWILKKRFAEGAQRAYITVLERNSASCSAIERAGFRAVTINEVRWLFNWRRFASRNVDRGTGAGGPD